MPPSTAGMVMDVLIFLTTNELNVARAAFKTVAVKVRQLQSVLEPTCATSH